VKKPGFVCVLFFAALVLHGQEDFGFGNEETESSVNIDSGAVSVKIGGEVSAELKAFPDESSDMQMGDIFSGKVNLSASASAAEGVINLKLKPVFDGTSSPVAYRRSLCPGLLWPR